MHEKLVIVPKKKTGSKKISKKKSTLPQKDSRQTW